MKISNKQRTKFAMSALMNHCGLNKIGAMNSYGRMLSTCKNYSSSYDEIGNSFNPLYAMKNFSVSNGLAKATGKDFSADFSNNGPGMSDNNGIAASDIVDITISASVKSFLEFLAIDKACDKPNTILSASRLVRVIEDEKGIVQESVADPFAPMNPENMDLSITGAAHKETFGGSANEISLGFPIAIKRTVGKTAGGILVEDVKGDGTLSFSAGGINGKFIIDYVNGVIKCVSPTDDTVAATPGVDIEFTIYPDTTSEKDGLHTQVWREVKKKFEVNCEPVRVKLEQSIEKLDYDKKLFNISRGAVAVNMTIDAFIYSLNVQSVKKSIEATLENFEDYLQETIFYDISDYATSSFAPTKDNIINDFMLALESDLTLHSDKVYTYIMVGNLGARVLQNVKDRFQPVANRTVDERSQDNLIGYYNEIPVLRHQLITSLDNSISDKQRTEGVTTPVDLTNTAHFFVGYRSPSGTAAPVIYAEYLPIISTRASLNYYNPTEISQVLFNYSKFEKLVTNYARVGLLKVSKHSK